MPRTSAGSRRPARTAEPSTEPDDQAGTDDPTEPDEPANGTVGGHAAPAAAEDPDSQSVGPAAVVLALERAAARRELTERPEWEAVRRVLADWTDAGAARTPDRTGGAAGTADSGTPPQQGSQPAIAERIDLALDRIAAVFALDATSTALLLVAAAADIDPNIAVAYGLLLGADRPRPATAALALELTGTPITSVGGRAALGPNGPLRRWGLVQPGEGAWSLGRSLTVGEDVVGALLGQPVDEPMSAAMAVHAAGAEDVYGATGVESLTAALTAGHRLCWVEDPPGGAGPAVARTAFAAADIRCASADLGLRPSGTGLVDAAVAAVRWAGLHSSGLVLESAEQLATDPEGAAAVRLLALAPIPVVMVGSCRWNARWHRTLPVTVRTAPLRPEDRLALWRKHITEGEVSDGALVAYRLTPEQIDTAARHATAQAAVADREPDPVLVAEAVRMLGGSSGLRSGLGWARTTFDDLEVPGETRAALERLSSWVRLRDSVTARGAVHGVGGKGTGIAALFTGSPGTGKTLAAHVIADTAGLDLMQVDLSGVIDKYIGETEKNLERVFADAENLNVVLFFDEADALFGKRSEVRDAHDRFANQEVSYLLQRMEQFDGITVLATNLKGNLDIAFARRMHFIVHFPDPDEPTRRRLLTRLLASAGDPDPDDPVDVPKLAGAVELAGGDLRNIVLAAVYDAAIEGTGLGMRHLVTAAIREHAKLGRRAPSGL